MRKKAGYVRTKTPLMAKSDLYKISGHWDHYKEGMFVLGDEEADKEVLALRPMTCPLPVLCVQGSTAQLPGSAAAVRRDFYLIQK